MIDRYIGYWNARFEANSGTPDPNDPALREYATGEQLETVLLKVVDTGVRGFVFESPDGAPNSHVDHARETWHIPIEQIAAGPAGDGDGDEAWLESVCDAVDATLGVER